MAKRGGTSQPEGATMKKRIWAVPGTEGRSMYMKTKGKTEARGREKDGSQIMQDIVFFSF